MGLPETPQTLTAAQVADINQRLSTMRHNINNHLSLLMAAVELLKYKPEMREKMLVTLSEQPPKIISEVAKFSLEFEKNLGITREDKGKA
jgi:hypothetical protein